MAQSEAAPQSDFPEVGGEINSQEDREEGKKQNSFINQLFPNDSVTKCDGFINEIRSHNTDEDTLYFLRVGLIQGSERSEDGSWRGQITNCDLLAGKTVKKWISSIMDVKSSMNGVRVQFHIRNLKFSPGIHEGKPVMNSKGVLEKVVIGQLDS